MWPALPGTLGFCGSFIPAMCSWPFSPLSIRISPFHKDIPPSLGTQRRLQHPKGSPAPRREAMPAEPRSPG